MYKIEITADTLAELAGKTAALAAKLNTGTTTEAPAQLRITAAGDLVREVAEAAPAPLPASPVEETASSSAEEKVSSGPTEATPPAGELNFDIDVAPHVLQVVKEKGKPVAQEILSQFGVEKASLLDPALWPELVQQLKDAL
jgi:hypothetical protein